MGIEENNSWFKWYRAMQSWEWRDSPKHYSIFGHCLERANYKQGNYRGEVIPRGSFTTSLEKISTATGISLQGVRTVLRDLESTHEITKSSNKKRTMITITYWEKYQDANTPSNIETTLKQHRDNIEITTNKKEKKEKKEKEESLFLLGQENVSSKKAEQEKTIDQIIIYLNEITKSSFKLQTIETRKIIKTRLNEDFNLDDFKQVIREKNRQWKNDDKMKSFLRPETLFSNKFESYLQEAKKRIDEDREVEKLFE